MKNLVLSFSTAAREDNIRRFVGSLREVCAAETTDVVLFCEPEAPFKAFAAEHGVTLVPVPNVWKRISASLPLKIAYRAALAMAERLDPETFRAMSEIWIHPQASRYLYYENFVRANSGYGRIMLSDSRDVVFQDDPFAALDKYEHADGVLHAFDQDPSLTFDGQSVDAKWLARVYGDAVHQKVQGEQTLCSGTTFAARDIMLDYLAAMSAEVLAHRTRPLDQAMHNKVVHLDWPKDRLLRHRNVEAPVMTMYGMADADYRLADDGRVYSGERLVPVLHQWEHIVPVKQATLKRYEHLL